MKIIAEHVSSLENISDSSVMNFVSTVVGYMYYGTQLCKGCGESSGKGLNNPVTLGEVMREASERGIVYYCDICKEAVLLISERRGHVLCALLIQGKRIAQGMESYDFEGAQ